MAFFKIFSLLIQKRQLASFQIQAINSTAKQIYILAEDILFIVLSYLSY
jgi:hypothetical protein